MPISYLRSKGRGLASSAKKLCSFCTFHVLYFLIVEKSNSRTAPYNPISIMLELPSISNAIRKFEKAHRTSLLVTGFSNKERCVSLENFPNVSRSASSAKLFEVRIRVVRFGIEFGRRGCMLLMRFLASRRVCSLGESGKFESAVMSLSVKSMASWSYKLIFVS